MVSLGGMPAWVDRIAVMIESTCTNSTMGGVAAFLQRTRCSTRTACGPATAAKLGTALPATIASSACAVCAKGCFMRKCPRTACLKMRLIRTR